MEKKDVKKLIGHNKRLQSALENLRRKERKTANENRKLKKRVGVDFNKEQFDTGFKVGYEKGVSEKKQIEIQLRKEVKNKYEKEKSIYQY